MLWCSRLPHRRVSKILVKALRSWLTWCFHFLANQWHSVFWRHIFGVKPWLSRYQIIPANRHMGRAAGIPAPRCPPLLCLCRVQRACGASGCLAVTASPTLRFRSVVIENDWNKVEWSQVDASGKETTGYSSYRPTAGVWCFVKKVAVKVEARPTWQSCIIMWLFIIINPST